MRVTFTQDDVYAVNFSGLIKHLNHVLNERLAVQAQVLLRRFRTHATAATGSGDNDVKTRHRLI